MLGVLKDVKNTPPWVLLSARLLGLLVYGEAMPSPCTRVLVTVLTANSVPVSASRCRAVEPLTMP